MKFLYVDESGSQDEGDVFVMAGVLIDAYRLRKHTANFAAIISVFLAQHPGERKELKTKSILNGAGGWSKVAAEDRKGFIRDLCKLAAECAEVFAIALSFDKFADVPGDKPGTYWITASMFCSDAVPI